MAYKVDFENVSTIGLETSPVADVLAGLRANEAQYFWNKYQQEFITMPASESPEILNRVKAILGERKFDFPYTPLEVSDFVVNNIRYSYVFYDNGLTVNVLYSLDKNGRHIVVFKLADGIEIPDEFVGKYRFVPKKSELAGTSRDAYFAIKGNY